MESATSNWVYGVAPASLFNQHVLYPAGLELVLALPGRRTSSRLVLGVDKMSDVQRALATRRRGRRTGLT